MPKKLSTPLIKPRTQGGTFYTFSSALEDVGLNINELKNKVELSHYVLLDIPEFPSAKNFSNFGDKNVGDYSFAQMFQNYVLNFETILRNQDTYNFAESLTVSERVFWNFMKSYFGMSFSKIDNEYYVENNSSIVQAFGQISAGAQRTDSYGIYNETFVQIPSSFGKMPVLFKPVSDKNYYKGGTFNNSKTEDGKCVLENINENNIDKDKGILFTGLSYETIPSTGKYSVDDETSELCLEFSIQNLRKFYDKETLSYDDIALNNDEQVFKKVFGEDSTQPDSYKFNAILVYYSIYDSTGKNVLATNAYGILLLNSAVVSKYANTQNPETATWIYPEVEKRKTTPSTSGNSYSFRLNIKTSSVYGRDIVINDNSTPTYEMAEDFNDVIKNLSTSIDILRSNANTIKILASEHADIKNFAAMALDKVNDLERDINILKSGVSRNLTTNYLETDNLKAQNILADIKLFDSMNNECGAINGQSMSIGNINSDSVDANEITAKKLTAKNLIGEINVVDKENYVNANNGKTTKLTPQGIYVPNDLYVYNNSSYIDDNTYKELDLLDVEQLCNSMHIYLDTNLNKYFVKFDENLKEDDKFKPILNDNSDYSITQMLLFAFVGLKQKLTNINEIDSRLSAFDYKMNDKLTSLDSELKRNINKFSTSINDLSKNQDDLETSVNNNLSNLKVSYGSQLSVLDDKLTELDSKLSDIDSSVSNAVSKFNLSITKLDSSLTKLDTSVSKLDSSMSTMDSSMAALDSSFSKMDSSLTKLDSDVSKFNSSITKLDSSLTNLDTSVSKLDSSMSTMDSSLAVLDSNFSKMDSSLIKLDSSMSTMDSSLAVLDSSFSKMDSSLTQLDSNVSKFNLSITQLDSSLTQLDISVTKLDTSVSLLDSSMVVIDSNISLLDSNVSKFNLSIANLDSSLTKLDSSMSTMDSSLAVLDSSFSKMDSSLSKLDSSMSTMDSSLAVLDSSFSKMDSSLTHLNNSIAMLDSSLKIISNDQIKISNDIIIIKNDISKIESDKNLGPVEDTSTRVDTSVSN